MQTGLAISLSVGSMALVLLIASFLFQDKEGGKPARHAFRVFYLFIVLFFIVLVVQDHLRNIWIVMLLDICIAASSASLTVGILWRSTSRFPVSFIYTVSLCYIAIEAIYYPGNIQLSYGFIILCSLIGVYGLFKRQPEYNAGDLGIACVLLIWSGVFFSNIWDVSGELSIEYFSESILDVIIFAPAALSGLSMFLFSSYMLDAQKELTLQASTDVMTGLYNRRFLMNESRTVLSLAKRYNHPISVLLCDVDRFKLINDNYGHEIGDLAIKAFADTLQDIVRTSDILARYGGEEFVAVLPQTNKKEAMVVAERMRVATEKILINTSHGDLTYTASFGVSQITNFSDIEVSIAEADQALYEAKNGGRNKVCLFINCS